MLEAARPSVGARTSWTEPSSCSCFGSLKRALIQPNRSVDPNKRPTCIILTRYTKEHSATVSVRAIRQSLSVRSRGRTPDATPMTPSERPARVRCGAPALSGRNSTAIAAACFRRQVRAGDNKALVVFLPSSCYMPYMGSWRVRTRTCACRVRRGQQPVQCVLRVTS